MIISKNKLSIVKQNLRMGEEVLKEFKTEHPYIRSNTMMNIYIERHKNDSRYTNILPKLSGKSCLAGLKINEIRYNYERSSRNIEILSKSLKRDKSANCKECTTLIFDKLLKRGCKPQNIKLDIVSDAEKARPRNHTFTVIGLDNKADIAKPHTWGKDCIIIDGWATIVKRAQDGVEYLKQLFCVDSEQEKCIFKNYSSK